ncbi:MAG: hypothetical protein WEA04_03120 [Candidatus Andersenbacteria bacterium]
MLAVVHVLAGAAVGAALDQPTAVVVVAFFLHYFMDLLPHIDAETFAAKHLPYSWNQFISLIVDGLTAFTLSLVFFLFYHQWFAVLIGSIASLVPDLLIPLERYRWFWPLQRFHYLFHWNQRHARYWSWYIAGLVTPTVFALAATVILWASF